LPGGGKNLWGKETSWKGSSNSTKNNKLKAEERKRKKGRREMNIKWLVIELQEITHHGLELADAGGVKSLVQPGKDEKSKVRPPARENLAAAHHIGSMTWVRVRQQGGRWHKGLLKAKGRGPEKGPHEGPEKKKKKKGHWRDCTGDVAMTPIEPRSWVNVE